MLFKFVSDLLASCTYTCPMQVYLSHSAQVGMANRSRLRAVKFSSPNLVSSWFIMMDFRPLDGWKFLVCFFLLELLQLQMIQRGTATLLVANG